MYRFAPDRSVAFRVVFVTLCFSNVSFCFVLQQRTYFLFIFHYLSNTQMIVATDVAARGLDIPGVDMVFHYRLPKDKVRAEINQKRPHCQYENGFIASPKRQLGAG